MPGVAVRRELHPGLALLRRLHEEDDLSRLEQVACPRPAFVEHHAHVAKQVGVLREHAVDAAAAILLVGLDQQQDLVARRQRPGGAAGSAS